jgi:HEPN domain-containing protein
MPGRHEDWLWQGRRDLEQARASMRDGFHEWACFAAHQAAEKGLKGVYQKHGADAWGHVLADLIQALPAEARPQRGLVDAARELDKHYIAPRYPNTLPGGAPGMSYTEGEAQRAIDNAERILRFCESHIL